MIMNTFVWKIKALRIDPREIKKQSVSMLQIYKIMHVFYIFDKTLKKPALGSIFLLSQQDMNNV